MATTNRPTQGKRNRELALKDRHKKKEEKRAQRKELKKTRDDSVADGEDPDLAGIVPGPQPPIEY